MCDNYSIKNNKIKAENNSLTPVKLLIFLLVGKYYKVCSSAYGDLQGFFRYFLTVLKQVLGFLHHVNRKVYSLGDLVNLAYVIEGKNLLITSIYFL